MSCLRLTPHGHVCWDISDAPPDAFAAVRTAFERDWRAGLFALAAGRGATDGDATLRYWQQFAQRFVTALCHVADATSDIDVEPPSPAELTTLTLTAPPMRGGEYLSVSALEAIWSALTTWAREAASAHGGLGAFLAAEAPQWHQVGRVCFHLAENKSNPDHPFAFLATYATGFGTGGRVKHLPLRQALQQYAGARNKPGLVKLLTPVDRAAETCGWVRPLVESGAIFQPLAWSPAEAYAFLLSAPALEDAGLAVRMPDWWKRRPRPRVSVTIGRDSRSALDAGAMLEFDASIALGDETLTEEELEALLAHTDGAAELVFLRGQWVEVDRARLAEAIDHWRRVERAHASGEVSFIEGMRLLAGAPADLREGDEPSAARSWAQVEAGPALLRLLADLRDPSRLARDMEGDVRARLRPYQRDGVAWLDLLSRLGLGACLADDMGLGKTLQVLALLAHRRCRDETPGPALLVAPASLLANWEQESRRFTPSLRLLVLHPALTPRAELEALAEMPARRRARRLAEADLVITTYAMLTRQEWVRAFDWPLVVLDEAQAIRNSGTRQSRSVRGLSAGARIALTGTPVENHLGDLWSIFDFLNPGLLGSARVFKSFVKALTERASVDTYAPLRRLVGPYILRRLKTDRTIIADLPEKTEAIRYCPLTRAQVALYQQTVRAMETALASADGIGRRGLVLQTLLRLKQICNHPSQLAGDGVYEPSDSGKFQRLAELCGELAERQARVLVFTQFREIIDPLADHLAGVFGRDGLVLHGGTAVKERRRVVDRFQDEDGPPFLVLSLKAGGTGLNLTEASHVVHFDRWWNPAVEDQATDRAFRIGQTRNVLVHKFVTSGTVEQRIDELIAQKRAIAQKLLPGQGGEVRLTELPDDELLALVRLDIEQAMM